jgi:hypothetical protein
MKFSDVDKAHRLIGQYKWLSDTVTAVEGQKDRANFKTSRRPFDFEIGEKHHDNDLELHDAIKAAILNTYGNRMIRIAEQLNEIGVMIEDDTDECEV